MIDFENLPPCFQKHLTNTIGYGKESDAKMLWGNMSYQQQVHWIKARKATLKLDLQRMDNFISMYL
jgi:hypothetical protein